jgi:hypothetical protein
LIGIPTCWKPIPGFAVTGALKSRKDEVEHARSVADALGLPFFVRRSRKMDAMFAMDESVLRFLVVQSDRWLLVDRDGGQLHYHPNMGFVRLGNYMRGQLDHLLEACALVEGDRVLDATLGYGGEALLCAHAVGESGVVHGVEGCPELGLVVSRGLATLETQSRRINAVMRRVKVVHLGHHLEYLQMCPDNHYDVICFDPFFEHQVGDEWTMSILRTLGEHAPLTEITLAEAMRVARKRVVVKATKWSGVLEALTITNVVGSKSGKVCYGILHIG